MSKDDDRAAPGVDANTLKQNEIARAALGTGVKPDGFRVDFRGGTAALSGSVGSEDERRRIVEAARGVSGVSSVNDGLRVGGRAPGSPVTDTTFRAGGAASGRTHTVKSGDTLSKIARDFYGDANAYDRIFQANRNILTDPDKIKPGQVLNIPE